MEKCNIYPTMISAILATFILLICSIVKRSSPSPTGNIIISPATSPSVASFSPYTTDARCIMFITMEAATTTTYSTIKKWSVILLQIAPINLISYHQTTIRSVPKLTLAIDFWSLISGDC